MHKFLSAFMGLFLGAVMGAQGAIAADPRVVDPRAVDLTPVDPRVVDPRMVDDRPFYERKAEGWFWYHELYQRPPSKPRPAQSPKPVPSPPSEKTSPRAQSSTGVAGGVFSAAWFRRNIPKYLDMAWTNPTPENVRAYFLVQRYAIDRSEQFADQARRVVYGDPLLDELSRMPSSTFAAQKIARLADRARANLLKRLSQKAGLFVFFREDCPLCADQARILAMLKKNYGFAYEAVSEPARTSTTRGSTTRGSEVTSLALPAGHVREDANGLAGRLGVKTWPATFLVTLDGRFYPVGQGAMALEEMSERILLAALRAHLISPDELDRTRPIANPQVNIAKAVEIDPNGARDFIPPKRLLALFNGSIGERP